MGRVRRRRSLQRQLEALKAAVLKKERQLAPSAAERRLKYDAMIVGLRARLEDAPTAKSPTDAVELEGLGLELFEEFQKRSADAKARRRAARTEFLARTAAMWTRALRGPTSAEVGEKNIPMAPAGPVEAKPNANDIASGFSSANASDAGYGDSDVHGATEASIWQETSRRYGSDQ